MAKLSSSAWILHDVGLATAIGGTLFGRQAFHPSLRRELDSQDERDRVADTAWRRFSWINLAAHGMVAATWFTGRTMLSGREVSRSSRNMTLAKDALVIAGLVTGVTSVIIGRMLGKKTREGANTDEQAQKLRAAVGTVGLANLATNIGLRAVTTALSMEASKSAPFSFVSRRLP